MRPALGLRSVRRKSARLDHLGRDRRDDGGPLWPGAADLGAGPWHGLREDNLNFPKAGAAAVHRGDVPKSQLQAVLSSKLLGAQDWRVIREGLEVKLCPCPDGGAGRPISCAAAVIAARKSRPCTLPIRESHRRGADEDCGRLLGAKRRHESGADRTPRPDAYWDRTRGPPACSTSRFVPRKTGVAPPSNGRRSTSGGRAAAQLKARTQLRTNVTGWSDEDLWRAYIQLTDAGSAAFPASRRATCRYAPCGIRKRTASWPSILVCASWPTCFWKFLGQLCLQRKGLGNEPRHVLDELSELCAIDVVMPTRDGQEIRTRCVTAAQRPPKDSPPCTPRHSTTRPTPQNRFVVEKSRYPPLQRKHLRQTLGKLG